MIAPILIDFQLFSPKKALIHSVSWHERGTGYYYILDNSMVNPTNYFVHF